MARATRWSIPDADVERHVRRRGRRHAVVSLDPPSTALVVVDMIPFFADADPELERVGAAVDELAGALRAAGGTVAWVVPATAPVRARDREFFGDETAERYATSGGSGTPRSRLARAVTPSDEDLFAEKMSPGAFFPGRCDLHEQLAARAIDTVIVAGTVANVCCESTAREAATLGYRVILAADALGATDAASLAATCRTIYRSFGDVRSNADLVDLLDDRTGWPSRA